LSAPGEAEAIGIVITVVRGGCEVVYRDERRELRLTGRSALHGLELAVGDEVEFDPERGMVRGLRPRRTELRRRRPRDDPRKSHVIAANLDRVAIVTSLLEPPFRPGLVDRFQLAAYAGGLDAILVANKLDLLAGADLPDEVRVFEVALPVVAVSALTGAGLDGLRAELAGRRSVLAGHSGVGKSSLLNALEPELRLETGPLAHTGKGRHTTRSSTLIRLRDGAIVVDTPGIRELASGSVDPSCIDRLYPDIAELEAGCRFRDCRHASEPDCVVVAAVSEGRLSELRYAGYRRLWIDIAAEEA
jgi:ribosome biogenesis GTPase